jgi:hypothetical protein
MEALMNSGVGPSFVRTPPSPYGLFAQPDMFAIVDAALGLDWTLIGYEVAWDQTPDWYRDDPLMMEATNHRELAQAMNLAEALDEIGPRGQLMVWCGNGHHSKVSGESWIPMGVRFQEVSDLEPFSIDQLATVALGEDHRPRIEATSALAETLGRYGGTAGFIAQDPPEGFEVPAWCDATILSTDNRMVGEVGLPDRLTRHSSGGRSSVDRRD